VVAISLKFPQATVHPHLHLQAAIGNYGGLLRPLGRSAEDIEREVSALAGRYGVGRSTVVGE